MKGLFWLLLGLAIAFLTAPRSGIETRRELMTWMDDTIGV